MVEKNDDDGRVPVTLTPKKPANDIVIIEFKPPTIKERLIQMMMNAIAGFFGGLAVALVVAIFM